MTSMNASSYMTEQALMMTIDRHATDDERACSNAQLGQIYFPGTRNWGQIYFPGTPGAHASLAKLSLASAHGMKGKNKSVPACASVPERSSTSHRQDAKPSAERGSITDGRATQSSRVDMRQPCRCSPNTHANTPRTRVR